jgi:hypothetical protein
LYNVFKQDGSPPWHGIEYGLELLKEGMIWRVGTGRSINIWRDNWIPRDYNLKASPKEASARIRRVGQLLTQNPRKWNEELIKKICDPEDVMWILKQKIPSEPCEDLLAWHYERTGEFLVKSVYRLAYNILNGTRWRASASSAHDHTRNVWKGIWNAKIPSKVKIFGWRLASDNLATKKNKFKRTLELDIT